MYWKFFREEKSLSQIASQNGVHPNQVRQWRDLALERWPQAFEKENRQVAQIKAKYESQLEERYAEVGRLSTRLAWAEKNPALLSRDERLALLDSGADRKLPLTVQTEILPLNRTSLYYPPVS